MKPVDKSTAQASSHLRSYWSTATVQLLHDLNSASTGLSQSAAEQRRTLITKGAMANVLQVCNSVMSAGVNDQA